MILSWPAKLLDILNECEHATSVKIIIVCHYLTIISNAALRGMNVVYNTIICIIIYLCFHLN